MFGKRRAQLFDIITPTATGQVQLTALYYTAYTAHTGCSSLAYIGIHRYLAMQVIKGFPWTNYGQVRMLGISSYSSGFWEIRTLVQHALVATLWLRDNGH